MSRDAQLGLVVGLGLVLTIGIVFFRREPAAADAPAEPPNSVQPTKAPPPSAPDPSAPAPEPPPLPAN